MAYCTIPCAPDYKRYIIVFFDDHLYLNHNLPFGIASAVGLQGEVAGAVLCIWDSLKIAPVKKWVDDISPFRFPSAQGAYCGISGGKIYRYDYDYDSIKQVIAPLGVPWHREKGQPFGDVVDYLGFSWDIPSCSVTLTISKHRKYIVRLSQFLSTYVHWRVPKEEGERVAGYLQHCTFVFPSGQSYLASIYAWLASFPSKHAHRYMPHSLVSDLKWWLHVLQSQHTPHLLFPKPPTRDYDVWVDASSDHGIGLLWKSKWYFWRMHDSWHGSPGEGQDIGWLEAIAIELAIRLAVSYDIKDADILIHSDNEGVIQAFRKGHSCNHMVNMCIRHSDLILSQQNLSITLLHIASALNLADPVSCGIFPNQSLHLSPPPSLPPDLAEWFHDA